MADNLSTSGGDLSQTFNAAAEASHDSASTDTQSPSTTVSQPPRNDSGIHETFRKASTPPEPEPHEEETLEGLRAQLEHLEDQRPVPKTERHYTIGGTIETQVHSENAQRNEDLIKSTQEKIRAMEKEQRRKLYMERARKGPDESEDPTPVQD